MELFTKTDSLIVKDRVPLFEDREKDCERPNATITFNLSSNHNGNLYF